MWKSPAHTAGETRGVCRGREAEDCGRSWERKRWFFDFDNYPSWTGLNGSRETMFKTQIQVILIVSVWRCIMWYNTVCCTTVNLVRSKCEAKAGWIKLFGSSLSGLHLLNYLDNLSWTRAQIRLVGVGKLSYRFYTIFFVKKMTMLVVSQLAHLIKRNGRQRYATLLCIRDSSLCFLCSSSRMLITASKLENAHGRIFPRACSCNSAISATKPWRIGLIEANVRTTMAPSDLYIVRR